MEAEKITTLYGLTLRDATKEDFTALDSYFKDDLTPYLEVAEQAMRMFILYEFMDIDNKSEKEASYWVVKGTKDHVFGAKTLEGALTQIWYYKQDNPEFSAPTDKLGLYLREEIQVAARCILLSRILDISRKLEGDRNGFPTEEEIAKKAEDALEGRGSDEEILKKITGKLGEFVVPFSPFS